jgi:hypothetical protein
MLCVQIDAALVTSTVRSTPQWMARELKLTRIIQQPRPTCAPLVLLWELLTKKNTGQVPQLAFNGALVIAPAAAVGSASPERVAQLMQACRWPPRAERQHFWCCSANCACSHNHFTLCFYIKQHKAPNNRQQNRRSRQPLSFRCR